MTSWSPLELTENCLDAFWSPPTLGRSTSRTFYAMSFHRPILLGISRWQLEEDNQECPETTKSSHWSQSECLPTTLTFPTRQHPSHRWHGFSSSIEISGSSTFVELASNYFKIVTTSLANCKEVHIVFDQYWDVSIKAGERALRCSLSASLEVKTHAPSTPVPTQWGKFVLNPLNK